MILIMERHAVIAENLSVLSFTVTVSDPINFAQTAVVEIAPINLITVNRELELLLLFWRLILLLSLQRSKCRNILKDAIARNLGVIKGTVNVIKPV